MIYRWTGRDLVPAAEPATAPDVVDSWLEDEGHVARFDLHRERFGHLEFLAAARSRVPHEGRWFPRVEKHADDLYLRVRPAPPLRTQTVLWIPPTPDPRQEPLIKGPDLAVLAELRAQAQAHGADDALLWTPDRLVPEGANCAIAWWEGERLMFPEHPGQLPSVTARATREMLGDTGTRPITVEELLTFPVWAGSALHGWTEVVGWAAREETPMSAAEVTTLLRWG